jgi:hypothetical protein
LEPAHFGPARETGERKMTAELDAVSQGILDATPATKPARKAKAKAGKAKGKGKSSKTKAAKPSANGDGKNDIRWTEKKVALLRALVKLGATSGDAAVLPEKTAKASNGKALGNPLPAYDMSVQGYLAWSKPEGERAAHLWITAKGRAKLEQLSKA